MRIHDTGEVCGEGVNPCRSTELKIHDNGHAWCRGCGRKKPMPPPTDAPADTLGPPNWAERGPDRTGYDIAGTDRELETGDCTTCGEPLQWVGTNPAVLQCVNLACGEG